MKHQEKQNDAGFTLIEVMMALLVFAIGTLALAQLQIAAIQGNANAEDITEASVFSSDLIEQMSYWDYTDIGDGQQTDPSGVFEAEWVVANDEPVENSTTIDITVTWQGKDGQKTLSMTTIKTI